MWHQFIGTRREKKKSKEITPLKPNLIPQLSNPQCPNPLAATSRFSTNEPNPQLQGGKPDREIPSPNRQSATLIFAWLI